MQFMWQASGTTRKSQIDTTSHFAEALGTHLVIDYSFRTCQNLWSIKLVLECSVSHSYAHENRCIKCGSFHRTAKADTAKKPNSTIATVQKKFAKPGKDTLAKKGVKLKFCSAYYDCAKRMILKKWTNHWPIIPSSFLMHMNGMENSGGNHPWLLFSNPPCSKGA